MIKLMNAMQYDASGISPNEFKFGLSFFSRSIALSRFPWLSANIEYQQTREPYFSTPYTIKQIEGVKIAIVGLTSDGLMEREHFEMEEDVQIEKHYFHLNAGFVIFMRQKCQTFLLLFIMEA